MYKNHGGDEIEVSGVVCNLPPQGYGIREERDGSSRHTYHLEETEIIKRSERWQDQYWEKTPVPQWYTKAREMEAERQAEDPKHFDKKCETFRYQEWCRRMRGVWFWNKGRPVYITGLHYMYIQYWTLPDGDELKYRECDRLFFYFLQYCIEDPDCLGLINVAKRKAGKTARSGIFEYEYISRNKNVSGGIQSMNDTEASKVFRKGVVQPWRNLPHFFRPIYDILAGDRPDNELKFFHPTQRGQNAGLKIEAFQFLTPANAKKLGLPVDKDLESAIDYKPSSVKGYDGPHLHRYVSDECGKLEKVDINERHETVRYCSYINHKVVGKQLYTTTVEDLDSGGKEFEILWNDSDHLNKKGNRMTGTGLYQYFEPAYTIGEVDKYGYTDELANKLEHDRERLTAKQSGDQKKYFSTMRKNAFNISEVFKFSTSGGMYSAEKINTRLAALEIDESLEEGVLQWKDNQPFTEVVWIASKGGRWQKLRNTKFQENNVVQRGSSWVPLSTGSITMAFDPFSHSETQDGRGSLCAATAKFRRIPGSDNPNNGRFFLLYHSRRPTVTMQHEDLLLMAWYCGCQALGETQKNAWEEYFKLKGCYGFLMQMPGYKGVGIPGSDDVVEKAVNLVEEQVEHYIDDIFFPKILSDWKNFEFKNRTKYDIHMASAYNLLADHRLTYKMERPRQDVAVESFYGQHEIVG